METWGERVERAAKVLGVPKEILVLVLDGIGVSEVTIKDVTVEDFKLEMAKDQRVAAVAGPIKVASAYKILTGAVAAISDDASARDLLAAIDLKRPSEKSKKAATLLKAKRIRSDEPRTWGDAHFVVLADDGAIDLPTSDLAMSALESGAPDYGNGVFTSKEGRASAVFRLDDLTLDSPRSLRLHDPLEPSAFLDIYRVSRKFSVVIDLDPERHQLLLFAVHRGHKSAPRDAAEAASLVALVKAASTTEAAAVALGPVVDALWRAARRAPSGSAAALPSITEAPGAPPAKN